MDEVALARHGESASAARGVVGGDAPLTARGRDEARRLGDRLRQLALDACVTSRARRARETAAVALAGRGVPVAVEDDLGDIRFGAFEGGPLAEYRAWVETHRPDEAPPGGESRVETLRRFARGFRAVLARRERCILVVAHGLTVRSVLDEKPQPIVAGSPYGGCVILRADELERAVDRLERWCDAPGW
jgi:ribonuclease H / adenosylcobalamin/alpha-ribazole phosphatase